MKKILSLLGTITLIGTSTTNLFACDNISKYTPEKLAKLKEENKIKTNNQKIRDNLEWIAPQEKPLKEINNKYYFVVWRSDTSDSWRIIKFLNDTNNKKILDSYDRYKLIFKEYSPFYDFTLLIRGERGDADHTWKYNDGIYFKSVYRWNLYIDIPDLVVNNKTGEVKTKS